MCTVHFHPVFGRAAVRIRSAPATSVLVAFIYLFKKIIILLFYFILFIFILFCFIIYYFIIRHKTSYNYGYFSLTLTCQIHKTFKIIFPHFCVEPDPELPSNYESWTGSNKKDQKMHGVEV